MKIYFAGAIRGGRDWQRVYAEIINCLNQLGTVMTEHLGQDSLTTDGEVNLSEAAIFKRDIEWIRQSDVVVAEVSVPSLGVGYEIGFAEQLGKQVICLYNTAASHRLSAMISGNQNVDILQYDRPEDVMSGLKHYIK